MRWFFELTGRSTDWAFCRVAAEGCPLLPMPYLTAGVFLDLGQPVVGVVRDPALLDDRAAFPFPVVPLESLRRELGADDVFFAWAGAGVRAILQEMRAWRMRSRVIFGSYVWAGCTPLALSHRVSIGAARLTARRARALCVMTAEQTAAARAAWFAPRPVVPMTVGVDTEYFAIKATGSLGNAPELEQLATALREGYFVVGGDQLRHDDDALALVASTGLILVRVLQNESSAAHLRAEAARRNLSERVVVLCKVSYPIFRFLLQHACGYAGVVDARWQPAGWTVACEALAAGCPVVLYAGLAARELQTLGAAAMAETVSWRDVRTMGVRLLALAGQPQRARGGELQAFAARTLALRRTAPEFARSILAAVKGEA